MEEIDKITRGHQANRLLEDDFLQECIGTLEQHAISRLRAADVNDTRTLQTLVMSLQAASGFRRQLEMVARDGLTALEHSDMPPVTVPFRRRFASAIGLT
jgi:hypothetical protein